MEGECQFRASYDLLSFDFSAFSQISNNEAYIWSQAIRCGRVLSNEIKLDHGFHLRNFDKPTSANGLCGGGSTSPVLINTGLQAGVQPALISIKPLKQLNSMSHGEPPARRAMLIRAQLTARSKGGTTMLAICPAKPGLIFHRA
jgi:hypothetical protein